MTSKVTIPGWKFDQKRDPSFRFDPEPHEYWLKDNLLWGFSAIVKAVGWVDDTWFTEESRVRGTHVHMGTHFIDEGGADWSTIRQEIFGYIMAYENFKKDWNFKPRLIELPLYHPLLLYGVTPDREGLVQDGDPAIVELKSGALTWVAQYQTAAQDLAIQAWEKKPTYRRRIGVKLLSDGTYIAKEYKDPRDYDRWKCAVVTAQSNQNVVLRPKGLIEPVESELAYSI